MSFDVALESIGTSESLKADRALIGSLVSVYTNVSPQVAFHGECPVTVWTVVRFEPLVRLHVGLVVDPSSELLEAFVTVECLSCVRFHVDVVERFHRERVTALFTSQLLDLDHRILRRRNHIHVRGRSPG